MLHGTGLRTWEWWVDAHGKAEAQVGLRLCIPPLCSCPQQLKPHRWVEQHPFPCKVYLLHTSYQVPYDSPWCWLSACYRASLCELLFLKGANMGIGGPLQHRNTYV